MKSKTLRFYDYIYARFPEFQYADAGQKCLPGTVDNFSKHRGTLTSLQKKRPKKEQEISNLNTQTQELTPRRCATPMSRAKLPPITVQPLPKTFKVKPLTIPSLEMPEAPRAKPQETEASDIFLDTAVNENQIYTSDSGRVDVSGTDSIRDDEVQITTIRKEKKIKIDTTGFPEIPPLAVDLTKLLETMPEEAPDSISPYTFQESIDQLDDEQFEQFLEEDPLLVKSGKPLDNGFTPDEFAGVLAVLDHSKYEIIMRIAGAQYMRMASIFNYQLEYLKCDSFREFANMVETNVCDIFGCRTALLWRWSKVNNLLINYSHLMKYPDDKGFLGTCVQEKRSIIAPNPTTHQLYDEMYDLPLCEEAEMIAAIPIIDDSEVIGCVLMIDKIHESGATFLYWPQSDIYLLKTFNSLLPRVFTKFTNEIKSIKDDIRFVSKCITKKFNLNHLVSYVISSVMSELDCNSCSMILDLGNFVQFEKNGNQLTFKVVPKEKFGVSGVAMNTKQPINLLKGGDHPSFNKFIDDRVSNSSLLVIPIIYRDTAKGTCICRRKKMMPFFNEHDIIRGKKMMLEFAPIFDEALTIRNHSKVLKNAISGQNKLASLLQTAESLSKETNLDILIERILVNSKNLVEADRGSLFIVDDSNTLLISKVAQGTGQIVIPIKTGIVGAAVASKEPINIADVYQDSRFNSNVDKKTGYRTKSLLTVPITDQKGNVIAVTQLMNKANGKPFTDADVELTKAMNVFTAIALKNSKSIADAQDISIKIKALINTAKDLASDSTSLTLHHIVRTVTATIGCENAVLRSPGEKGATNTVMQSGKALKIDDITDDVRYEISKDTDDNIKSIIAVPVRSISNGVVNVLELQNKKPQFNGGKFTESDMMIAASFASYIGVVIDNNNSDSNYVSLPSSFLNEQTAKQTNPPKLMLVDIGTLRKDVLGMTEVEAIQLIVSIFNELGLMSDFSITNDAIVSLLLRLKANADLKRVASSLHLFYHILQTGIKSVFTNDDIFAMAITLLVCKVQLRKDSEMLNQDEFVQLDIALNAVFSKPSRKFELCEYAADLLSSFTEIKDKTWKKIMKCLIATEPSSHFHLVESLWTLVRPTNQMLRNPIVVMQCIVKLCGFSELTGPFIRTTAWSRERGISTKGMICFIELYVLPLINAMSEAYPELKTVGDQVLGNLSQLNSKCV